MIQRTACFRTLVRSVRVGSSSSLPFRVNVHFIEYFSFLCISLPFAEMFDPYPLFSLFSVDDAVE